MRTSVIPHPPRSRFVALRPHYVEMTGHGVAALVLSVVEGWTNWKLQAGEVEDAEGGIWIKLSVKQIERDLCGAAGKAAIGKALDILLEKGYVERREPPAGIDRSALWRLRVERVVADLPKSDNGDSPISDNGEPISDSVTRAQEEAVGKNVKKNNVEPEVLEVWEHYVRVFNATRQTLDDNRKRIIRNALKVRSVAECKRAIDGLRVDPWFNGENPSQQKYLGIQYALKGNSGRGESTDERIDKMAEKAPVGALSPSMPRKAAIRFDNVQRWVASGRTRETRRSKQSKAELEEMGYKVTELEEAPWVLLEHA